MHCTRGDAFFKDCTVVLKHVNQDTIPIASFYPLLLKKRQQSSVFITSVHTKKREAKLHMVRCSGDKLTLRMPRSSCLLTLALQLLCSHVKG